MMDGTSKYLKMHLRDYKLPGNVYSETHEFRVKGYVVTDMVLCCHFIDEEIKVWNCGLGSLTLHIV